MESCVLKCAIYRSKSEFVSVRILQKGITQFSMGSTIPLNGLKATPPPGEPPKNVARSTGLGLLGVSGLMGFKALRDLGVLVV